MSWTAIIILSLVGIVIVAILIEAYIKRGRYRPLAAGVEFDEDHHKYTPNTAEDEPTGNSKKKIKYRDFKPEPYKDDANYARLWHQAHGPKEKD